MPYQLVVLIRFHESRILVISLIEDLPYVDLTQILILVETFLLYCPQPVLEKNPT